MKTLVKHHYVLAALAVMVVSGCGKARYEQRQGAPQILGGQQIPPQTSPQQPATNPPVVTLPKKPVIRHEQDELIPPKNKKKPKVIIVRDATAEKVVCAEPVEGFNCYKSQWLQPADARAAKVDLVFVVDNSEGIGQEVERYSSMVPSEFDYNIVQVHPSELTKELNASLRIDAVVVAVVLTDKVQQSDVLVSLKEIKKNASANTNHSNIHQRLAKTSIAVAVTPSTEQVSTLIRQTLASQLKLKTDFTLITGGQVDPNTVCAVVNGVEVPVQVNAKKQQIQISAVGRANSMVEYFYCSDSKANLPASKYATMRIDNRCKSLRSRFNR